LKNVFEKLRFRDGLVQTVGLTVEIKLRFQILRRSVEKLGSNKLQESMSEETSNPPGQAINKPHGRLSLKYHICSFFWLLNLM